MILVDVSPQAKWELNLSVIWWLVLLAMVTSIRLSLGLESSWGHVPLEVMSLDSAAW